MEMGKKGILLLFLILFFYNVSAATYYIDYSEGSDSNNGTSTFSPWKYHPFMQGWEGGNKYSHQAGDRFIFKGGVIWPNQCFRMDLTIPQTGGSSDNPDYYGIDKTWYSGSHWSRPIFSAEGKRIIGGGNQFFFMYYGPNVNNIIIDNIEFTGFYWDSIDGTYGMSMILVGPGSNVTIQNSYFHNWTHGTCESGTYDTMYIILGSANPPNNAGSKIENCIFDGSPNGIDSGAAVYTIPIIRNSTARNMSNGFLPEGVNAEVSGSIVGPIHTSFDKCRLPTSSTHENNVETLGSGVIKIFNNILFSSTSVNYLTSSDADEYYIFNNIFYDNEPIPVQFDVYTTPNYKAHVWNNIIETINVPLRIETRGMGNLLQMDSQNNIYIKPDSADVWYRESLDNRGMLRANIINDDHNLIINQSTASAMGLSKGNYFNSDILNLSIYDKGIDLSSYCLNDKAGPALCKDIRGVDRQNSTWDIGPYERLNLSEESTGFCGDGVCNSTLNENCSSCSADCGNCTQETSNPANSGSSGGSSRGGGSGGGQTGNIINKSDENKSLADTNLNGPIIETPLASNNKNNNDVENKSTIINVKETITEFKDMKTKRSLVGGYVILIGCIMVIFALMIYTILKIRKTVISEKKGL